MKEKENKQPNILKSIRQSYFHHFLEKSALSTVLMLFISVCLIGGYFLPISLIITVPFLVAPILLGYILENISVNGGDFSLKRVFLGFKLYYSPHFFGCFRMIIGTVKAMVTYLVLSITLFMILHYTMGMNNEVYANIFNAILNSETDSQLLQNLQDLTANHTYIQITNIALTISIGLASMWFIHHVLVNSLKIFYNVVNKKHLPMNASNFLFALSFKKYRRYFYIDYYQSFWFIFLTFIACYVGGCLLAIFVFNQSGAQTAIIGLFAASLVSVYLLPYIFDVYFMIFSMFSLFYLDTLFDEAERLKLFGVSLRINEEEKKNIKGAANELLNALKSKPKKEDKEENKKQ